MIQLRILSSAFFSERLFSNAWFKQAQATSKLLIPVQLGDQRRSEREKKRKTENN
jgi:hypothetical protein